jgi:ABC-type sugar transport system ATPase subunit
VLLLDEPSRGVDVGAKFDIHTLLRELSAAGASILLASTDLPELIGMTDRIAIMRAGRIAEIVETAGLDQAQLLALIFGDGNLDAQPRTVGA